MLVKLCSKSALSVGEILALKIKGHEVMVVNIGSKIVCLDGRCTHAGAPLAEGILEGEVLTCPWHYSQFNVVTGEVIRGPAGKPLKTYIIEEKDGIIYFHE